MSDFHITIQGRGDGVQENEAQLIVPESQRGVPLPITFNEAYARFESIDELFIEPDGAFGWVSRQDSEESWRVDGCLYDSGPKLQYVEMKGHCSATSWQQFGPNILNALNVNDENAIVQLVRAGIYVSINQFERYLASSHS